MKKFFLLGLLSLTTLFSWAQSLSDIINVKEVTRIETALASDDMRGRRVFTPDIERAADFIASEFKADGLKTFNNSESFKQEFAVTRPKFISVAGIIDGQPVDPKKIIIITSQAKLDVDQNSGYQWTSIQAGQNLQSEGRKLMKEKKNLLVLVDTSFYSSLGNLIRLKSGMFKSEYSIIFILAAAEPKTFSIQVEHETNEMKLSNVVGVIPGKKDEYVVFSGHYDHLGVSKPVNGDSIYNGANDDASGITAVIMLAKYFKAAKDNERTLIFVAFTAEESGGYGSQYFSKQLDPGKVKAMFNIEMIGTESKWGKNSAFITGYEKTNMGEILAKDLKESEFSFYPDPYPAQQLFYRSDNATLARLGVPAHTISTSKMDAEPNYHKPSDEVETLDLENMTRIIRAIAISSKSIIAGKETPSRVKVEELR
jgi:hypothetical protein